MHSAAFADPERPERIPAEATLVDELRVSSGWIPELSLVAVDDAERVVGHVMCSHAALDHGPSATSGIGPVGLGPIGVLPDRQHDGVGSALMHAVLAAADALECPVVALLGSPDYYRRFGFRRATTLRIEPPVKQWDVYFQVRTLSTYTDQWRGTFRYAEPFDRV